MKDPFVVSLFSLGHPFTLPSGRQAAGRKRNRG
jgi:hypothetical protein